MTVTKTKRVRRYTRRYIERGDIDYTRATFQDLVEETRWRGILIWRRVLDTEQVPEHVLISLGAVGDTGGWKSKFAEFI